MPIAQFSGLASGIDSKSLIDAIVEARQLVNQKRQSEIDHLTSENESLDELNTKLLKLSELVEPFRTTNGGGVAKKAASTDATVATALVGSTASNASYTLTVSSVADSATASFNQTYSSLSDFVSTSDSGTVTILVGDGAEQKSITATVTVNSTTVSGLVAALNSDTDANGRFAASAVNVGTSTSPSYKIVMTTLQQGTSKGLIDVSADLAITELQAATEDQATDAVFSISGISGDITRSSNSISDVISGVSFNIAKTGSTNISIGDDASSTLDKMKEIVEAYNDIVEYIRENDVVTQNATSRDKTNVYGSLAKSRIDNDFLAQFRSSLSAASSESGTAVTSFSEMGVRTLRDGTLQLDEDDFLSQIGQDPLGASEVLTDFADSVGGITGLIYQFTKVDGFIDIGEKGNLSEMENINRAIEALNRQTDKMRESLERQFSNLESITGNLQSQQNALSGILAGLNSGN